MAISAPNDAIVIRFRAVISSAQVSSGCSNLSTASRIHRGEVTGRLRDADGHGCKSGDRKRDPEAGDAGEPGSDMLGEHDVAAPICAGEGSEAKVGGVDRPPGSIQS